MTSLLNVSDCPCGHCQSIIYKEQGDIVFLRILLDHFKNKDQGDRVTSSSLILSDCPCGPYQIVCNKDQGDIVYLLYQIVFVA